MNPKEYKDMMSHLTRPDTRPPEVQKAAAEKQFNSELDRKNKLKKSYELPEDTSPVMYNPPSNSFKTENELKKEFDQESMKSWVKNTTALNKNPGAFKKEVKASQALENQPGYIIDKDPNLLRRIKLYSDKDLGASFDAAIAEEDAALKKLGRDPMNILQRNKSKKAVAVKPKVKPFVKKPKQLELPLNIPKIDFNLLKSPVGPDAGSIKQEPVTEETRIEDDPKYRNTIFGTDVLYRRKRGLDD